MTTRNRRNRNSNYVHPTCPPGWAWLLAGILIGVFISFLIYLREIAPHSLPEENTATVSPLAPNLTTSAEQSSGDDDHSKVFTIYDPKGETTSSGLTKPSPESIAQTDLPITIPGRYLLQVGSFRNEQEANGLKAHLASLGIPARIEKTTLNDRGRWHRVQVGPFSDLDKLNQTRSLLAENNLSFILLSY
jgi:cell division protein FtsN